jgi:hypothetical protein
MISLMGPMEWLLSIKWIVKLDFRILYLKSWKCSLYLLWNDLPVWPTYFMWQCGHVKQYMSLFSYCCRGSEFYGLMLSRLLMVLLAL